MEMTIGDALKMRESMSVFGNSHYQSDFLAYYESQIQENSETSKLLTQAPNYYAWIHIASENVYYRIKEMIYVNETNIESFNFPYKRLLDHLFSSHDITQEQKDAILLFAKIRHLLVHKGFPNPHTAPSDDERKLTENFIFSSTEVKATTTLLRNPACFNELKDSFSLASKSISALQQEYDNEFGSVRIRKIKC
jgi:hypothetical protein